MAGRFSIEAVFKAVDRITAPVSRMQNRVGKFTRGMERGLRRVNRITDRVAAGIGRVAKSALRLGAIGVAAGVAATAVAINKVAGSADSLAKRTRRIQFPIKEFQEWQFVAEQSGLGIDEFDKSIEKFTKTVGEARAGTGTLFTILKKTNKPLLRQLTHAKNSAEAFEIYIDAIRKTENQLDKTALATAAFGRTGAKFLNITEQSAEAVAALRKEQRENGVISAQSAAAAEAYNDAVNSLKRSLGGLLQGVILPLLPKMTDTIRLWRDWIVANRQFITIRVFEFLEQMKKGIIELIEKIRGLNESHSLFEQLTRIMEQAAGVFSFISRHGLTILKIVSSVAALALALKTLSVVMGIVNLVMSLNPIGLLIVGVTTLIGLLAMLVSKWDSIKATFSSFQLPSFLQSGFDADFDPDAAPKVVSPQDRIARSVEERRTTNNAEITLKSGAGTSAELTKGKLGNGLKLQSSGAF